MNEQVIQNPSPLKVAYVLKRFPRLSETFILNEILELERQGVHVEIFSLLRPPIEQRHKLLMSLRSPVTYLPSGKALGRWSAKTWDISAGTDVERIGFADLLASDGQAFETLMPGKSADDAAVLGLRALSLAMLVSAHGIHHMHAHFGSDATTAALLASRLTGIPFSYTAHARDIYHTYVNPEADADMRGAKLAEAAFVATVSDYNRAYLSKLAKDKGGGTVHRLYNGIDLKRFHPDKTIQREDNLLLSVGRLVEKKGFDDLLEACRTVSRKNPDFRCMIVGDGPLREDMQSKINAYEMGSQVELSGALPQEEVIELMHKASALALPCIVTGSGDRDGLPTVLLEALAIGLPCISTDIAGIPEIIDHNECGLLVPQGNPSRLAAAIARLLSDEELRARLAAAGREKCEKLFNLSANARTLIHLFWLSASANQKTQRETIRRVVASGAR